MGSALLWGAVAASSLVIGAALALVRDWSSRAVGIVLAFGAGALISAVSFELAEEGIEVGSLASTAAGLAAGALTFYVCDGLLGRRARNSSGDDRGRDVGRSLALGAFLDGVPEQLVLGIGIAGGAGVSAGLLVAIFVSNLPEAIGAASEMGGAGEGDRRAERRSVIGLWLIVAGICTLATVAGYALADAVSGELRGAINGFAAGALLVMLIDSMIPDATADAGRQAGLVTALGFAVATALSTLS